jgi:hypothetical protein
MLLASGCGRIGYEPLALRGDATPPAGGDAFTDASEQATSHGAPSEDSADATSPADGSTDSDATGASDAYADTGPADAAVDSEAATPDGPPVCGDGFVQAGEQCDEGPGTRLATDPCTMSCTYNWWNTSWTYRRQIVIDNRSQSSALADIPIAVQLASSFDYASMQSAGQDLRFVASDDATVLPYEIEVFDDASGASVLWVRVPSVSAASSAGYIWMYYGNASASAAQQAAQVWNTKYLRVWHLNGNANDSAGIGSAGTIVGATTVPGQLGNALSFDGATAHVDMGSPADLTNLFASGATLTAWVKPVDWGGGGYGRVLDKSASIQALDGWGWQLNQTATGGPTDALRFEQGWGTGKGSWVTPMSSIALGTFVHLGMRYWGSSTTNAAAMSIDGVAQTIATATAPAGTINDDTGQPLWIGNVSVDSSRGFNGIIDEVRIEPDTRSDDWIRAEYQFTLPAFILVQAKQTLGS